MTHQEAWCLRQAYSLDCVEGVFSDVRIRDPE
jgi:hypothetical protein